MSRIGKVKDFFTRSGKSPNDVNDAAKQGKWSEIISWAVTAGFVADDIVDLLDELGLTAVEAKALVAAATNSINEESDVASDFIRAKAALADDFAALDLCVARLGMDVVRSLSRVVAMPSRTFDAYMER